MTDPRNGPALPGEECQLAPHESWTELEKWVWHEIGSGRVADINQKLGQSADPKTPNDWGPERRLSARFLKTILLHDPWCSATPRQGVRILGALLEEQVDLQEGQLTHQLWMQGSRFTGELRWAGLQTKRDISF